jgi:2-C-methyl-D-erythritol 2,4-cyclodiphosphate synthase
MRIGHGYDVHRTCKGRECIICGVSVPSELGLDGHSDADVAVHALMDAILGAAAMGDIGRHFPDTDDAYKGISSLILLDKVMELIDGKGYRVSNADVTIIAQKPKMAPYIDIMVQNLSEHMHIPADCVNVKATTEEHLGFTGDLSGIAAHAVVLLEDK